MRFAAQSLEAADVVSLSLSSARAVSFDVSALGEVTRCTIVDSSSVETLALGVGALKRIGDTLWISQGSLGGLDAS